MKRAFLLLSSLIIAASLSSCMTPEGLNQEQQRKYAYDMADEALQELYKKYPESKETVKNSAGYVIYSTWGIDYFILSTENGFGVAVNNKTGEKKIMTVLNGGLGLCLGVASMRDVLIFANDVDFDVFCNNALSFDLKADAIARFSQDSEAYVSAVANISSGDTKAYKIGYRGLLAEAVVSMQKNAINYSFIDN